MSLETATRRIDRVLIANRGEVAVRLLRGISAAGATAVVAHAEDDAETLAVRLAGERHALVGAGPAAYLDADRLVEAALAHHCDAVHPGYGFLSEDAAFAEACERAGVAFIGPDPAVLALFGHKARARELARSLEVPVLRGTATAVDLDEARGFLAELGPGASVMVKAVAGGGGRGMRVASDPDELASAWERCRSEAEAAFGDGALMVEQFAARARHIEVQVIGDGTGAVSHLGERECSLQRRNQKIIEIAPAPNLGATRRAEIHRAAVALASHVRYRGLGTFEFLAFDGGFAFLEANPRLQVEHTITEEVTGIDLVRTSVDLARGATLADLDLTQDRVPVARGTSIQARVNMETIEADGTVLPSGGRLDAFEPPTGPGIRVDTFGYPGYETSPRYDSLLMKVVATDRTHPEAIRRLRLALDEAVVAGVATNVDFLAAVLDHPQVREGTVTTRFVDEHREELLARMPAREAPSTGDVDGVVAPLQGSVVEVLVAPGDAVAAGTPVIVLESMKMEHVLRTDRSGYVRAVAAPAGTTVSAGSVLVEVDPAEVDVELEAVTEEVDLDHVRPDLAAVLDRKAKLLDAARPEAVAKRHAGGKRTAWENVEDLCDDGTFREFGGLVVAAQRKVRSFDELVDRTPRDGIVTGIGKVNGESCTVLAYDYTVLAGTQGYWGHKKKDRMLQVAREARTPVIVFTEGGGGRAGDTDPISVSALDTPTLAYLADMSGHAPTIAITSGYCFAGNAVLLGLCDVVIATRDANIGIGGPAMVVEAGLGDLHASEIGPHDVQTRSGVIDISVEDEEEAVAVARRYLSYFQGPTDDWTCQDQRALRSAIPENRLRAYDVRRVIELLADDGSVLELRPEFGLTSVTSLARIEGRPVGIIANNPMHLAGAVDTDGADKVARFLQLCDAYDLPIVSLCDTPGIMVGPDAEGTGLVRHASRTIAIGANVTVPFVTVVLRKAYGIGAQVMAAGHFRAPLFVVSWPTGEFGPMGMEGTIRLSHRKELAAIEDPEARDRYFRTLVDELYERSNALGVATAWEIDDVIDPAESRAWILSALDAARQTRPARKQPYLDTW